MAVFKVNLDQTVSYSVLLLHFFWKKTFVESKYKLLAGLMSFLSSSQHCQALKEAMI